jgi:hypothetical protein
MTHRRCDPPDHRLASFHYDYARFGRHRLRAPNAAIIDFPLTVAAASMVWVATVWPDLHVAGGWARQLWTADPATGHGWQLPLQLAAGDVVEFGADTPEGPVRWYGIMDSYEVDRWATVQGPYPHPSAAYDDAQRLLAQERYVEALSTARTGVAPTPLPASPDLRLRPWRRPGHTPPPGPLGGPCPN